MASYFSQAFGITRTSEDDWFDPVLSADTQLFVDPFLIFLDSAPAFVGAHDELVEYFNICFTLVAESQSNTRSIAYQKALSLLHFPEPREFCLGYAENSTHGAGGGSGYANLIAMAMNFAIQRGVRDLRHFEELGVLEEGIGPDRISDLTCNVLRSRFIAYTESVVARHELETSAFTFEAGRFDPRDENHGNSPESITEIPHLLRAAVGH